MTVQTPFAHLVAWLIALAGCSVISPPPMMQHHDDPIPEPDGDVRVLLVLGVGGGVFVDGGIGFELRASHQAHRDVEAGGGVGMAFNLERRKADDPTRHPRILTFLRGFGRYNPGSLDWLALEFGLGGGFTERGLVYFTLDTTPLVGWHVALSEERGRPQGRFLVYGGPTVAVSVPLRRGTPLCTSLGEASGEGSGAASAASADDTACPRGRAETPSPTFHFGGTLGFGFESASAFNYGNTLEATFLWALSANNDAALLGFSLGSGASFAP